MSGICKGCGKRIIWGLTPDGKRIPLDPSAPIYGMNQLTNQGPVVILLTAVDRAIQGPWVSHFATCSEASDFSASKKTVD